VDRSMITAPHARRVPTATAGRRRLYSRHGHAAR